ncbi:LysR family transcriptional regulator [Acuticoccus sp. MNP-M23]|uniref:LysR family transcriptional regulator n=1 Tax=Acuticoccus sp. MNP-M23 TaxID=3072793 RepID=UPI0028155481|nr:LysR family transcriptional regulator [Acuticoccus sp. MNP-M23]WMS44462.1 LysR family transcriptional regulator [Acuticoccus sp. MNP-M23]
MRVDYLGLEAFVSIAERGSFQRAADALSLSQTALSHRIRKIESELGVQLLERNSREVSLTRAGQTLLPQVKTLLEGLQGAYADVAAQGRARRRRIVFACLPTLANSLLPDVLARFADSHPETSILLNDMPVQHIFDAVIAGNVEFGITVVSADTSDCEIRPIYDEPYMLLVPADHPIAARADVVPADLEGKVMVRITSQSKNRQLVDDGLGEHRDRIVWRYEVRNAVTAMSLVRAGAAFTILPRMATSLAPDGLVALPFRGPGLTRTLGVATRRGVPVGEPAATLLAMIEAQLASAPGGATQSPGFSAPPERTD